MAENEEKPTGENEGNDIDWFFSSPVQVVFAIGFIISTILLMVTRNHLFDWMIAIAAIGYLVFMVLDKRE